MTTVSIKDLIKDNLKIPTIPAIVQRIGALIEDPNSSTGDIGKLVSEDPPLAAKVLRVANSAYYGLAGECLSTEHASTVLGVRVLRNIVNQIAVMRMFDHLDGESAFDVGEMWKHSTLTAHVCAFIAGKARTRSGLTPDEFYVCGLLHDVGKMVMLDSMGEKYAEVAAAARKRRIPMHLAETNTFRFNHSDVGAAVATRWGLPDAAVDAIQYHHGPQEKIATNRVVSLVANANQLVHRICEGNRAAASDVLSGPTATFLGLSLDGVNQILDFAEQHRDAQG